MTGRTKRMAGGLLAASLLAGCSTYGRQEQQVLDCATHADCNPGKACGELIACVEGRCDPEEVIAVACGYDCTTRDDCLLVASNCCCWNDQDDVQAIHRDDLPAWKAGCAGVLCDPDACVPWEHLAARCREGECVVEMLIGEREACERDEDCVEVPVDCCPCEEGGASRAIHRAYQEAHVRELAESCSVVDMTCPSYNNCTNLGAACVEGRCITRIEACGCPDDWDPLCFPGGVTYSNACVAACFGQEGPFLYHGHCDCQMQCDWGDPRYDTLACAANGVTYELCGYHEIACNGQEFLYPGACDPACDRCRDLGRDPVRVCVYDGYTYPDRCWADCLERPWLHEGRCLPGEGDTCGGFTGLPCTRENLYCTCPGCDCSNPVGGVCIQLGHCIVDEDCWYQGESQPGCDNPWTCEEHTCVQVCDDQEP